MYSLPLLYLIVYIVFWLVDSQKLKPYKHLKYLFQDHTDVETVSADSKVPHRLVQPSDYVQLGGIHAYS